MAKHRGIASRVSIKAKQTQADMKDRAALIALIAIFVFGFALSMLLFKGMSIYGDDFAYVGQANAVLTGSFSENLNIFSLRLLMDYPLAISLAIFGFTDLGAGAYALFSYLISIILMFIMGRDLYGNRAGVIAALLFAIYPLSLKYSSEAISMMPLAMFLSISAMFFIKGKKSSSKLYFALSGAFAFLAALVNPLAYLYILFFILYILVTALVQVYRKGSLAIDYSSFAYLLGLVTLIVIFGFINFHLAANHEPFFEFNLTSSYYSSSSMSGKSDVIFYTAPSLTFYICGYFPYTFYNCSQFTNSISLLSPSAALSGMFSFSNMNLNDVGLFSYAYFIAGLYLLFRRDKKSYFVLAWAAFIVAYMEFGTMSLTHYFPIYKLMKFTVVAEMPELLILGIALSKLIDSKKGRSYYIRLSLLGLILFILFITSLPMDYYYYLFDHNTMLYPKIIARAILAHSTNLTRAQLYGSALSPFLVNYYLGDIPMENVNVLNNGTQYGEYLPTCASIPNNTYLILPSVQALQSINTFGPWAINESWVTDPSECGSLVMLKDVYNDSLVRGKQIYAIDYTGNLYYKP